MERNFYSLKFKIRAFTLLECLLALLALSGSVLVISGLTKLMQQQIVEAQGEDEKDWHIFCEQMRAELVGAHFDCVAQDKLYVTTNKAIRFGLVGSNFRKTNANGAGYQPLLYGIKTAEIKEMSGLVTIQLEFKKGGERIFVYRFLNEK